MKIKHKIYVPKQIKKITNHLKFGMVLIGLGIVFSAPFLHGAAIGVALWELFYAHTLVKAHRHFGNGDWILIPE